MNKKEFTIKNDLIMDRALSLKADGLHGFSVNILRMIESAEESNVPKYKIFDAIKDLLEETAEFNKQMSK